MELHSDVGCFVETDSESDCPRGGEDSRIGDGQSLKRIQFERLNVGGDGERHVGRWGYATLPRSTTKGRTTN